MKEIEQLIRPELLSLKPYSSARSEFKGTAKVFVDANENPFDNGLNRYPDPLQRELKEKIAAVKQLDVSNLFLGNGSDEVLDLIFRLFCIPGKDEVIITPPTYGMYKVLAGINNVFVKEAPLTSDFQLDVAYILKLYSRDTKILFLCSPNNPTGSTLNKDDLEKVLETFPGIVVLDEAYIDFSKTESYSNLIATYPKLLVLQTLSKSWGLAGIRLGMGICHPYIVSQLNNIKPPYNINALTQSTALKYLDNYEGYLSNLNIIKDEKERVANRIQSGPRVETIFESDANFLLVKVDDADLHYNKLKAQGIIVRNRSHEMHCDNCLRITVGTPEENDLIIKYFTK